MDAPGIGHEVARLRRLRGLTQTELARRVGTQQPAIARIEQGHMPSLRTLLRVAEALNARLVIRLEPLERPPEHEGECASQAARVESVPVP